MIKILAISTPLYLVNRCVFNPPRAVACYVCFPAVCFTRPAACDARDVAALESTIAQLQHSGRTMKEDRDRMQQQLEQLEEGNSQLAAELGRMTERNARWAGMGGGVADDECGCM